MDRGRQKVKKVKLKNSYRIVIFDDRHLHTLGQIRYTIKSLTLFLLGIFIILTLSIFLIVALTPIKELIPGYPSENVRKYLINNAIKVDSLEYQLEIRDRYIRDFQMMLAGEDFVDNRVDTDTVARIEQIEFKDFNHDSVFQEKLEQEQFNLSLSTGTKKSKDLSDLLFFKPLEGIITNHYNSQTGHFGVDIVNKLNSRVSSVLDGTVISIGWTMHTGYVILVQHDNGLVTVYKHNFSLLKKSGDKVGGGEAIALMGNSGTETTGPHLHFEMWKDGEPLNPEDYINF